MPRSGRAASPRPPAPRRPPQVCTADGTCMDIVNAVPYIQKFKKHPVTGEPLVLSDLIRCVAGKGFVNGQFWSA